MGFLDGLKNKINESGYADKVSAGLNKIGEGLEAGSEKVHAFAESLQNREKTNIISPSNNEDSQTHEIQNRTTSTISPQDNNDITYQQGNYTSDSPNNYYRESFSVNENDSNGVRQVKETLQDVNTVLNNETIRNFSMAAKEIADGITQYKLREQQIEAELSRISIQNQNNLDMMKLKYEQMKPWIEELINHLRTHRKRLDSFNTETMNENDYHNYIQLSKIVDDCNGRIMKLYDKITG